MIIQKQTSNNGLIEFKQIDYKTAKQMIIKNHYSKKWNTSFGKINVGVFKDDVLLGCAIFGNLMNPNSYKSIADINKDQIIELNRLWIDDCLTKNIESLTISSSIKIIKKLYPNIKLIQSFADGRLGCGTIYQASNFGYYGKSESVFFENTQTAEVFHKVPLENTNRSFGFLNKNRFYLDGLLKPFSVSTYRYIYKIDKKLNLHLKQQDYPKEKLGSKNINFKHSDSLLARLHVMYDCIGDKEYAQKAIKNISFDAEKHVENALKNKSVIDFLKRNKKGFLSECF